MAQAARMWLEPITVLAALAMATRRIGLIATCSNTHTEPCNLARRASMPLPTASAGSTTMGRIVRGRGH